MAASQKGPSQGKSPASGKPASPDALVKPGKGGAVELSEEDLKKVSGGFLKTTYK
jgi:hypothetical protein